MSELSTTVDWSLATWQGSQREQLRRWAALPLVDAIRAVEEMQRLAESLASPSEGNVSSKDEPRVSR